MAADKVSGRYAKAIFDFLGDEKKIREMIPELKAFAAVMRRVPSSTRY